MEKKKKKNSMLIIGGLALAAVVGFVAFGSKPKKTALQRFTEDAFNPATAWGADVKSYLTTGGRQYTEQAVKDVINYHVNNNTAQFQKYM